MSPRPVAKIAALAPYALADLSSGLGPPTVSLAQNESLRPPSPLAVEAAARALTEGTLYPDPDWLSLRNAIAEVHGFDPAGILCGAGSMELIGALAQAYLCPGDRALTSAHGYLFFRTATALAGAETDLAPETDLRVDVDALLAAVRPQTRVVWVANPGNPTGTVLAASELIRLRDGLPGDVLLVIDEAYGEFADTAPLWQLIERGDTVVLRTFSKAYGLAGMRAGWGLFPAKVARTLRKVLNPNSVSGSAQAAAAAAMRDQAYMRETVAQTARLRDPFSASARALGLTVPESRTNFALLDFGDLDRAARADAALRAQGLLMRGMAGYGLPTALRATIAEGGAMDRALGILTAALQEEMQP
ncbi:MAG: histidinol-phosphate transaminase [Pseudomonadota bacterium]